MKTRRMPNDYLILDNALNRLFLPEGLFTHRLLAEPADVLWAAGGEFPSSLAIYRGVILTGSEANVGENRSWYSTEQEIVRECLARDIPLLGICFGAQFLCSVVWGEETVAPMETPEIGWIRISYDRTNPLFADLPPHMVVWSGHHYGYHAQTPSLAHSDHWDQQAFQAPDCRAWGIQFHPEVGWWYGSLFNAHEKRRNSSLPIRRQGRPSWSLCQRLMRNFTAQTR